jgi:hypothetical protein
MNEDFGLGLVGQKPDRRALDQWQREQAAKEAALAAYRAEYDRKVELYRYVYWALKDKPATLRDIKRRAGLMVQLEYLEWWFEVNSLNLQISLVYLILFSFVVLVNYLSLINCQCQYFHCLQGLRFLRTPM